MLEYWYIALRAPKGIILHIEGEVSKARSRLIQARKQSGDMDLMKIVICSSPTNPNEIWLVKK